MLPTGLTIDGLLTQGSTVVQAFGDVVLFVVVLGFGLWAVSAIPGWIKRARGE